MTSSVVAGAVDDRGVVLGDDDAAGLAQHVEVDLVELEADLLGDDLAAGEGRDVLQHRLAAVAEAGRLDRDDVERAADLVDDQGRQRLAVDVLGDDQQRLAGLDDLLQHRQDVGDGRDLALVDEDVGVLDDGLHALGVGDEVRRDVALVELHALGELELGRRGRGLLDGDDAVLADLVERVGDGRRRSSWSWADSEATWAISSLPSISRAVSSSSLVTRPRRPCRCRASGWPGRRRRQRCAGPP